MSQYTLSLLSIFSPNLPPFFLHEKRRSIVTLLLLHINKYSFLPFLSPQKIYAMDPPSISAQHTTDKKLIHKSYSVLLHSQKLYN